MTETIGNYSLTAAVLVAAVALLATIAAGRFESKKALLLAKLGIAAMAGLFAVASLALIDALVHSDFSIAYVGRFTERALPVGYKLAAFWAGQEGSLLLWALLLATLCTIAVFTLNRDTGLRPVLEASEHQSDRNSKTPSTGQRPVSQAGISQSAVTVAVLAVVCAFFACLMLYAANPFALATEQITDGHGLNPMLQDPGMIAHPPTLFFGYAGFTIPFAMMVAALASGRRDDKWIDGIRRWTLVSWLFLTVGILLGAQWAYVELGWGGYWAWDPVENASLLPWLTATALMHSMTIQQHRGMFRGWNALLIAATFVLCIFGTYLTRSGLVDSVHTFGESLVGTFFLGFLALTIVFSLALLIVRRKLLRGEQKLEALVSREGAFLATNVLLLIMTAATLIGTIFPAISGAITGTRTTLGQPFYNKVVGPMAMVLIALMSIGPMLGFGKEAARKLTRAILAPAAVAAVAATWLALRGIHNAWALAAAFIVTTTAAAILFSLLRATIERVRENGENPLLALVRLIDANHRRYGGQIVHVGIAMILVGVVGSSLFNTKRDVPLTAGETAQVGRYTLKLQSVAMADGPNYRGLRATITLTDANHTTTLTPERRRYEKAENANSVVAIESNWREDLYVNLADWSDDGKTAVVEAIVNPLVSWIWTGGYVLLAGTLVSLSPRLMRRPATVLDSREPIPARRQTARVTPRLVPEA
jgi:cytochrome c-type biogenesis protein CcmF